MRVTAERPAWAPEAVDMTQPSPARMYDALLGGFHNFAVDRQAAEMAVTLVPDLPELALSNRAFLRRCVGFMVDQGIRQFIDIGSGIPTVGNVHEVAHQADPTCRVAYVDIDPVAVAHAQAILGDDERAIAIEADVRTADGLFRLPAVRAMIDLDRPVGLLLVAVLHLLPDDDRPWDVVAGLRDCLPSGSYVGISHLTSAQRPDDAAQLGAHAARSSRVPIYFRTREEISSFFTGLTLVPPGVVELPQWRPGTAENTFEPAGRSLGLAGVGRKA